MVAALELVCDDWTCMLFPPQGLSHAHTVAHTHTFIHTAAAAASLQGRKWPRAQQQMHQETYTHFTLTRTYTHCESKSTFTVSE